MIRLNFHGCMYIIIHLTCENWIDAMKHEIVFSIFISFPTDESEEG